MEGGDLKVLIVDEEEPFRRLLRHHLKKMPEVRVIKESSSVEDALFKIMEFAPDILFLDIVMPGRNGTGLMELLRDKEMNCHVVVVSGAEDSAILAIKNSVYDFLRKPFLKEDLEIIMSRYLNKRMNSRGRKLDHILEQMDDYLKIRLSTSNDYLLLNPSDVAYCEAGGSYTIICLDNGAREVANNYLGMIERKLSDKRFFRISRSHLINLDRLLKVSRNDHCCTLAFGDKKVKLKVSMKQLKALSELDFD